MSDDIIGYYINCGVCGAFIEFTQNNSSKKPCPNGCTVSVNKPKLHGYITNLKVPEEKK